MSAYVFGTAFLTSYQYGTSDVTWAMSTYGMANIPQLLNRPTMPMKDWNQKMGMKQEVQSPSPRSGRAAAGS